MNKPLLYLLLFFGFVNISAQNVTITQETGWMETAYIKWTPVSGVDSYKVYYTGGSFTDKIIDTQLIRNYGSYYRADALGLSPGVYTLKVVPVTGNVDGPATVSAPITVTAHDRTGFAHSNGRVPGAYNLDGTLKANAVVLYVTQDTKNTISLNVTGANANPCVGLQSILDGFKKGLDTRPLAIRLIGNVTDPNYLLNGDAVIENKKIAASSITFEGVGSDALVNGWGIRIKSATNIEVRNLGFMLTDASEGDNLSLQQDNTYIWAHNNDLFYGGPGSDADQAKGDGALDSKKSSYVTFSYNHFWDNGKSCLLGLSEGTTTDLYITYHHNWFDHSDSRHPRVRYFSAHIYNNYYDGNSKYGAGSTLGSSLFVEGNYFRNCKYPMLISKQGTDIAGGAPGTFSNENGGMIKAHNNFMTGQTAFVPYSSSASAQFDAYVTTNRNEVVPSSITAVQGSATYNNFDTNPALYINSLVIDNPVAARDKTMQYSGRVSGGDISWTFNNSVDDTNSSVNTGLMAVLQNYTSQLVSVQGIASTPVSSQTLSIPSNNDQTVITSTAITPMIFTWGGTATDVTVTGLPASGITFVKNTTNKTVTISGNPTDDVSFTVNTVGASGTSVSGTGSISVIPAGTPQGNEIHNFTASGTGSTFYTFTSANMNSTDGSASYDGLTLTKRLKLESATSIAYNTLQTSTLTLVLDPTFSGTVKFDNVNYTATGGIITIPNIAAGSHTITKGSVANLFYIKTVFNTTGTLAVQESKLNKLTVYPNPVSSILTISTRNSDVIESGTVTNSLGQTLKTLDKNTSKIDMSDLSSGVYFLHIKTREGVLNQKIIKK
ncbi:pectate lyase family protein [Chryseobacterium caseinilyticum]|uniref:T9SS type A sorting domain-containing protein n=1 Tax=Chryseobacterium caseinilyticum TaxID=2771428 RepID=A0ABR8Z9G0_9FLAO|nr:T9SS type A sorting domain-containing protein [Chryseobacterium caseinilyticum]MBD8081939.1 T9SS type A sorting domain-containing protein [Chryseobacterium caseinilyticum]